MIIDDVYDSSVGFLFSGDLNEVKPVATVFYIRERDSRGANCDFAVTCAHSLEGASQEKLWLQVQGGGSGQHGWIEVPAANWTKHSLTDVVALRITCNHSLRPLPICALLSDEKNLYTGQELFLPGLFMPDSRDVVARFGKLSKARTDCWRQIGGYRIMVKCHLAETTSWEGQSGSPVFLNDASVSTDQNEEFYGPTPKGHGLGIPPPVHSTRHVRPPLIGILSGWLLKSAQERLSEGTKSLLNESKVQDGTEQRSVNSSLSCIIPARFIRQTIEAALLKAN